MKRIFRFAFTSWWFFPLCALASAFGCSLSYALKALDVHGPLADPAISCLWMGGSLLALLFGLLSLAAAVRLACQRRWWRAFFTLLALGAATLAGAVAVTAAAFAAGLADNDHFADDLTIPPDLELSDPAPAPDHFDPPGDPDADPYYAAVLSALASPGTDDPSIADDVPSLALLADRHPDLLSRYLAMHPAWRVFPDRGTLRATRAMGRPGDWTYSLNGYYSQFSHSEAPSWQVRLSVVFDPEKGRWGRNPTRLQPGETLPATLTKFNGMDESCVEIDLGNMRLEILEESERPERRITQALLRLLENELRPLADSPTEATLRSLLPPDATSAAPADILLRDSFQGGLYNVTLRANPGEPGLVWLKAFEVTTGKPLSAARLAQTSAMRLGWSSDPGETFTGAAHITIYEGNWGQYYAARFELWFRPDTGAPDRLLATRPWKIQGWMR
jgi:hypothetical protein